MNRACLKWSDPEPPNEDSSYTHVFTETPLGRIIIEWKGWKDYDYHCGNMPWDEFVGGDDLEQAKTAVQEAWDWKIRECVALWDAR